jgi:hypothetical protein
MCNYSTYIKKPLLVFCILLFFATLSVYSQDSDSSRVKYKMKYEIMMLIDKAYHQNKIDLKIRDSLTSYISKSLFRNDSITMYKEYEVLEELKGFLINNIENPDYRAVVSKSVVPEELPTPQYEKEQLFIPSIPPAKGIGGSSINKGVEGFYKNSQYMKSLPPYYNNQQMCADAVKRATESISRNLRSTGYATPAFIQSMSRSSSLFVRILAGFFGILDNGAQSQISTSSVLSVTGRPIPEVGQRPYIDNSIFLSKEFDQKVYNTNSPIKKAKEKKVKKGKKR